MDHVQYHLRLSKQISGIVAGLPLLLANVFVVDIAVAVVDVDMSRLAGDGNTFYLSILSAFSLISYS